MLWTPAREWERQDAYLIGGGASLRSFNFQKLKNRNTIGCNDAFRLGEEIVSICIFGDASWFHRSKIELGKFKNRIVSVAPSLLPLQTPMLLHLKRQREGIHNGSSLGWNFSTGATAINLAISLGAKRVFLLGYDVCSVGSKSHWHDFRDRPTRDRLYLRFIKGFQTIANHLSRYNVEVVHVIDGESKLPFFSHFTMADFDFHLTDSQVSTNGKFALEYVI